MIKKKICLLGEYAVGKTALVQQYAHAVFDARYCSSVGVRISERLLLLDGREMTLVLWDLEGKDGYEDVQIRYLRASMGFFVVADGTRAETLDTAMTLRTLALDLVGPVPHALLVNKADLASSWEIPDTRLRALEDQGITLFRTSAALRLSLDEPFSFLARAMLLESETQRTPF